MRLPFLEHAEVPQAKIVEYLLNPLHPAGRSKARFFSRLGYTIQAWRHLAEAFKRHAAAHEVAEIEPDPFGVRYVVDGALEADGARTAVVRVVWFVEKGRSIPRLISAYPVRKEKSK